MLTLSEDLINEIAKKTDHPHRLRVCRKLYDVIKLNCPESVYYEGVRVFLPFHHFPNFPNLNPMERKSRNVTSSFNGEKIICIYTNFRLDDEYIQDILKRWNQKYVCYYIYSDVQLMGISGFFRGFWFVNFGKETKILCRVGKTFLSHYEFPDLLNRLNLDVLKK
jgi:hypothetical protein